MSHLKERQQKNCLNCNTEVQGRYCQNCGQENIEPKETVWHLIAHFFQDITHFDGKFFSTVKYLVIRPGFLSREYMVGRRASYVNPIRMYIFTSAFFFLIFFSFMHVDKKSLMGESKMNGKTWAQITAMDSLAFDAFTKNVNKEDKRGEIPMTRDVFKKYFDSSIQVGTIHFTNTDFTSKEEYDSALSSGKVHHGWFRRLMVYKQVEINERYKNDVGQGLRDYSNILLHSLPQVFFVLLPLFALMLKLLYIRRKDYYYVNHAIFSLHFYIFSFINMLIIFALIELNNWLDWGVIAFLEVILGLGTFFYLYKAMRKFYMQRRAKTIFKFLFLCLMLFFTLGILFMFFILFSLFKL